MSYGDRKDTTVPCYNCSTRHENCHSTCEMYLAYKADREKQNELRRIKSDIDVRSYIIGIRARGHK